MVPLGYDSQTIQAVEASVQQAVNGIEFTRDPDYLSIALSGIKLVNNTPHSLRNIVGNGYDYLSYDLHEKISASGPMVEHAEFTLHSGQWNDKTKISSKQAPGSSLAKDHSLEVFPRDSERATTTLGFGDLTFLIDHVCRTDQYLGALADPRDDISFAAASYKAAEILGAEARKSVVKRTYVDNELDIALYGDDIYTSQTEARLVIAQAKKRSPKYFLSLKSPYEIESGTVTQHYSYYLDPKSQRWDSRLEMIGSAGISSAEVKHYAQQAAREFDAPRAIMRAIDILSSADNRLPA